MIQMLISTGRFATSAAAAMTVLACAAAGWSLGAAQDRLYLMYAPAGHISTTPVLYAALGLLIGLVAAGALWGVVAAIYDIQQSLRRLAGHPLTNDARPVTTNAFTRTEPQLRSIPTID